MSSLKFHEFLRTRLPWRIARIYYAMFGMLGRLARRLRYRRPPRTGWGQGWRVLIFIQAPAGHELHVIAPVNGLEFDFELLRRHVRGEVRPPRRFHEHGVRTADMAWRGHHLFVVNEEIGTQRIPMDNLIPGEFRGGALDVGLILIDVRDLEAVSKARR